MNNKIDITIGLPKTIESKLRAAGKSSDHSIRVKDLSAAVDPSDGKLKLCLTTNHPRGAGYAGRINSAKVIVSSAGTSEKKVCDYLAENPDAYLERTLLIKTPAKGSKKNEEATEELTLVSLILHG